MLGTDKLGVHDAGVPPMTDAFDTTQTCNPIQGGGATCWTYSAFPAQILFSTQLPILNKYLVKGAAIPQPTHDAAWWAERTKQFDFTSEDKVNPAAFNRVLWEGLMGGRPYPAVRSGLDLSKRTSGGTAGSGN